jgi:hypothetical protein
MPESNTASNELPPHIEQGVQSIARLPSNASPRYLGVWIRLSLWAWAWWSG